MSRLNARKLLKAVLATALALMLLVLALIFTSPWWQGIVLEHLLEKFDVDYDAYTLRSYSEFELSGVHYEDEGLIATVSELRAPSLPAILWNRLSDEVTEVYIGKGELVRLPYEDPTEEKEEDEAPTRGPPARVVQVLEYLDIADAWNFQATIEELSYEEGEQRLTAKNIHYADKKLSVALEANTTPQKLQVVITHDSEDIRVDARVSPEPIRLTAEFLLQSPTDLILGGQFFWREQPGSFQFAWHREGWIPDLATLTVEDWTLPESMLTKEDRQGYAAPVGSLSAEWDGKSYVLKLHGTAQPEDSDLPPLTAEVHANGNLEAVTLESFQLEGGWVQGQLYEPVTIPFTSLKDLPPIRFALAADFNQQSLVPLKGQMEARLEVDDRPEDDTYPLASALFSAKSLQYEDYTVERLQAEAELDWPVLKLSRLDTNLPDNSSLSFSGSYDFDLDAVTGIRGEVNATGALAQRYGVAEPEFTSVHASFEVDGPRTKPRHTGKITVDGLVWADDHINIDLAWKGEHGALEVLSAKGDGDTLDFNWEGHANLGLDQQQITLVSAQLQPRDFNDITLDKPFSLTHHSDGKLELTPLSITGSEGGHLSAEAIIHWPESGSFKVSGSNISPVWLKLLTDAKAPFPILLENIQAGGSWNQSPITLMANASAVGTPEGQAPIRFELNANADEQTLKIANMTLTQGASTLAEASGELPLRVVPNEEPIVQLETSEPANFQMNAKPGETPLWQWLQEQYNVVLKQPSLNLVIQGTLSEPNGQLNLGLAKLDFSEGSELTQIPTIENFNSKTTFSPDSISLETMKLVLADHVLEASGEQPMSRKDWLALVNEGEVPDIHKAFGKLNFENVPLRAFEAFIPDMFRPNGSMSFHAELKPGFDWHGELTLSDLETMPLPNLGSLSGIGAQIQLRENILDVKKASALVGGRELAIQGNIDITELYKPRFDLKLDGENVPFARASGMIIRGSPALTLRTDSNDVTTLAGKVQLNESFYTVDLTALGQSNPSDPAGRFPYFSIDEEPLASWRLDIDVEGQEFLRVRTPVFEGQISADLEVRGTLREPLATGQVSIERGVVMFPFANFRVEQGTVTIRQDNPFEPFIDVTATGRAYGYDLVMRLSGSPEDPQLSFTSTPALEQGDILLMVTAGRMPDSDQRSTQSRLAGLGIFIGNTILVDMGLLDPLDDQLQVYVGEDVTLTGKDTIRVVYRIDDTWALVGQYDRFDAYTLDLKWTIYAE